MFITKITMTMFGKRGSVYRVHDASGEVIEVCSTKEEAQAWIESKQ